jgi:glycosyltransferase involved in cell wall biosynthesis
MIGTRHKPRVSIGLPVYNGARYLAEALDSLLAQTYGNFELIICDNASTDQTEEICRTYAKKDERIHYIRNKTNIGASRNYMRTFESASAEYFRWATYDDISAPDFLTRCIEVLDRKSAAVLAYPRTMLINEHRQIIEEYEDRLHLQSYRADERFVQFLQQVRLCNAIYGLIRTEVLKRIAPLGSYIGADICFLAELTLYGTFYEIPEFLFYRRFHPEAYSNQRNLSKQLEFYNPQTKPRGSMVTWRHYKEHFAAVARAPLVLAEKVRLYRYLARMMIWDRDKLVEEFIRFCRFDIVRIGYRL